MDIETSRHRNSSSSTIHTASRFRHCCIRLSMKRWCQLNRARVAHDAHPALSSYQNKCSKPGLSHHSSGICYGAWQCYSSVYTTIPWTHWNLWSGQRRRRPISWAVPALVGPIQRFMCVTVCINFSLYISTFYVLCSSQVCSDCANVAMNGKVKAIWHKVQC